MADEFSKMLPISYHFSGSRDLKRQIVLPSRPTRLPKSEPTRRRRLKPQLLPYQHKLLFLLVTIVTLIQPTAAQRPYTFPALPQVFASKSACREVYDECMQAFRDCLKAVGGNESGRLGCEAYRNDVCEGHIRVGCDQLPNGGGSIGPVPTDIPISTGEDSGEKEPTSTKKDTTPSFTTFLTTESINQPQTQTISPSKPVTSPRTSTPSTTNPKPTSNPIINPEPDSPPEPETSIQLTDSKSILTTSTPVAPILPTTTTQPQQPQPQPPSQPPPLSTITLTSTENPPPTLATVAVVITTIIATTTDQAGISQTRTWTTSMTVTRGLTFSSSSGSVGIEWSGWKWVIVVFGLHIGIICL